MGSKLLRSLALFVAVAGSSCSSSSGTCGAPMGLYEFVYTPHATGTAAPDGDCPTIATRDVVLPSETVSGCVATGMSQSADGCHASEQEQCNSQASVETDTITLDSSPDETTITGTLDTAQFDINDKLLCQGNYTFTATRLHP